jgi:hypothetical protein
MVLSRGAVAVAVLVAVRKFKLTQCLLLRQVVVVGVVVLVEMVALEVLGAELRHPVILELVVLRVVLVLVLLAGLGAQEDLPQQAMS